MLEKNTCDILSPSSSLSLEFWCVCCCFIPKSNILFFQYFHFRPVHPPHLPSSPSLSSSLPFLPPHEWPVLLLYFYFLSFWKRGLINICPQQKFMFVCVQNKQYQDGEDAQFPVRSSLIIIRCSLWSRYAILSFFPSCDIPIPLLLLTLFTLSSIFVILSQITCSFLTDYVHVDCYDHFTLNFSPELRTDDETMMTWMITSWRWYFLPLMLSLLLFSTPFVMIVMIIIDMMVVITRSSRRSGETYGF